MSSQQSSEQQQQQQHQQQTASQKYANLSDKELIAKLKSEVISFTIEGKMKRAKRAWELHPSNQPPRNAVYQAFLLADDPPPMDEGGPGRLPAERKPKRCVYCKRSEISERCLKKGKCTEVLPRTESSRILAPYNNKNVENTLPIQ
ncbi:hypothetical protein M426DRAFT_15684 [Hypoxylon sp. CI-4A]|nr:hypothetical protein M426DRAFT_15684 [Hypoxylon sp. CI-4A]